MSRSGLGLGLAALLVPCHTFGSSGGTVPPQPSDNLLISTAILNWMYAAGVITKMGVPQKAQARRLSEDDSDVCIGVYGDQYGRDCQAGWQYNRRCDPACMTVDCNFDSGMCLLGPVGPEECGEAYSDFQAGTGEGQIEYLTSLLVTYCSRPLNRALLFDTKWDCDDVDRLAGAVPIMVETIDINNDGVVQEWEFAFIACGIGGLPPPPPSSPSPPPPPLPPPPPPPAQTCHFELYKDGCPAQYNFFRQAKVVPGFSYEGVDSSLDLDMISVKTEDPTRECFATLFTDEFGQDKGCYIFLAAVGPHTIYISRHLKAYKVKSWSFSADERAPVANGLTLCPDKFPDDDPVPCGAGWTEYLGEEGGKSTKGLSYLGWANVAGGSPTSFKLPACNHPTSPTSPTASPPAPTTSPPLPTTNPSDVPRKALTDGMGCWQVTTKEKCCGSSDGRSYYSSPDSSLCVWRESYWASTNDLDPERQCEVEAEVQAQGEPDKCDHS